MPAKKPAAPKPSKPTPAKPKEHTFIAEAMGQVFKRRSTDNLTHAVVWKGTRSPFMIWFLEGATEAKKYKAQVGKVFGVDAEIVPAVKH